VRQDELHWHLELKKTLIDYAAWEISKLSHKQPRKFVEALHSNSEIVGEENTDKKISRVVRYS
jgi:hypothetical protein